MVPKHMKKSNDSLGGDQESLIASLIELQEKIKNDKSVLRQPIDTGVRGVRDLIKAVVGGTHELQDLLLNECTIIYECKICRNLFRSLANFISHKRIYCIQNFSYFTDETTKQEKELFEQEDSKLDSEIVNCHNEVNLTETKVWLTSDRIVPNNNNIKTEKNNCLKPTRRIKISPVKITRKCDIAKIADGLNQKARKEISKSSEDSPGTGFYSDIAERVMMRRSQQQKISSQTDNLSEVCTNELFQSNRESGFSQFLDSIQLQAIEKISTYNEAVLQENGKFRVTPEGMQLEENENLENYKCTICETHFITKQTLSRHVQIHHKERICYPCPICRNFFPSPSSTYRHLSKDHHKTEHQIRRLRPKVLAKAIKRKLVENGSSKPEEGIQGKCQRRGEAVLSCSVCGKIFNRQAVLRVHLNSCKERESPKEGKSSSSSSFSSSSLPTANFAMPDQAKTIFRPPHVNQNFDSVKSGQEQRKSGILVRRDYRKKSVNNFAAGENQSLRGQSLKRINKWRTVLEKLQTRNGNGFELSEKSGATTERE